MHTALTSRREHTRQWLWVAGVLYISLAAWVAGNQTPGPPALAWHSPGGRITPLPMGQPAPAFALRNIDGRDVTLLTFGGDTLLLVFATSGCPYCRDLVAQMVEVEPASGVSIAVISMGDPEWLRPLAERGYPVLVDSSQTVTSLYRVRAVPTVYTLDQDGMVEALHGGMPDAWDRVRAVTVPRAVR